MKRTPLSAWASALGLGIVIAAAAALAQPQSTTPNATPSGSAPHVNAAQQPVPPPPAGHPHTTVAPAAQPLHNMLERVTADAASEGRYACCVAPACGFCAAHMAACPCGANVAAGQPVCRECKGGWDVGEGRVPGIDPASVKGVTAGQVTAALPNSGGMLAPNLRAHRTGGEEPMQDQAAHPHKYAPRPRLLPPPVIHPQVRFGGT